MKKIAILVVLLAVSMTTVFAVVPKHFAFQIGSGAGYDVRLGTVLVSSDVGFMYSFSDDFKGGFSFKEIGATSIDTINISVVPVENTTITMYTGKIGANLGFGIGLGYDFFVQNKTLFTSLGVYLDWFASNAATTVDYSLVDGGVIALGLKTSIGI